MFILKIFVTKYCGNCYEAELTGEPPLIYCDVDDDLHWVQEKCNDWRKREDKLPISDWLKKW